MRRLLTLALLVSTLLGSPTPASAQVPVTAEQTAFIAEVTALQERMKKKYDWFYEDAIIQATDGSGDAEFKWTTSSSGDHIYRWKRGIIPHLELWKFQLGSYRSGRLQELLSHDPPDGWSPGPDPNFQGDRYYHDEVIAFWASRCNEWGGVTSAGKDYLNELAPKLAGLRPTPDQITALKAQLVKYEENVDKAFNVDPPTYSHHPCEAAARDFMYVLYKSSNETEWACVFNYFLNNNKRVTNAAGTDCNWRAEDWEWWNPTPTKTPAKLRAQAMANGSAETMLWERACNAMGPQGCNTSRCPRHISDKTPMYPQCDGDLVRAYAKDIEKANAAIKKEIEKILGSAAASTADAQKEADRIKAELLARGTVLTLPLPLSDITVEGVIGRILNALLGIVGAIALLMFVWGGISWMMASGNPEQVGKAKKTVTWAALGLVAIFSAYAVLSLVINTFS